MTFAWISCPLCGTQTRDRLEILVVGVAEDGMVCAAAAAVAALVVVMVSLYAPTPPHCPRLLLSPLLLCCANATTLKVVPS